MQHWGLPPPVRRPFGVKSFWSVRKKVSRMFARGKTWHVPPMRVGFELAQNAAQQDREKYTDAGQTIRAGLFVGLSGRRVGIGLASCPSNDKTPGESPVRC